MDGYKENQVPFKMHGNFKIPTGANGNFFNDIIAYKPRKGDVFIATYPKCGTTWVQHIIYLLFNNGKPASNASQVITSIPFPEQDGFPNGDRPLAIKHHLPFHLAPFSSDSKHIYVVRNPLDTCVSYFHFLKQMPSYHLQDIDLFFEDFIKGNVPYGDFFDHLLSWSTMWHLPNVLFLTYEYMKQNHEETVKKIAAFLDMKHVIEKEEVLRDVVRYSTANFMKKLVDDSDFMHAYLQITCKNEDRDVFEDVLKQQKTNTEDLTQEDKKTKLQMIRKGCVGDYQNHFSQVQRNRMKEVFKQKTRNSPAESLWAEIFC